MIVHTKNRRYRFPNTAEGLEAAIERIGEEEASISGAVLTLDRNVTIPANVTILPEFSISVNSGQTLHISGSLDAEDWPEILES